MPTLQSRPRQDQGQSLTEVAIFVPILLLLIIGFIEIGVLVNDYINAVDSTRAAARYVSASDPGLTRCKLFGSGKTGLWITPYSEPCVNADYVSRYAQVKSWGADQVYATCETYTQTNFFYVAGCMAVLTLPKGALDPASKTVYTPNDYPGDDIVITTIPITAGQPVKNEAAWTWSLYGNQPSANFPSIAISITNKTTNDFVFQSSLADNLSRNGNNTAPPTGMVIVEVYRAHPQFTGLFSVVNLLSGSRALLPNPIPVHTFSVFPLVAIEPGRSS